MHPVLADQSIRVAELELQERLAWADRNPSNWERVFPGDARRWSPNGLRRVWTALAGARGVFGRVRSGRPVSIGDGVAAVPSS